MLRTQLKIFWNSFQTLVLNKNHTKTDHLVDAIWAGGAKIETDPQLTRIYHHLKSKNQPEHLVDKKTWSDLNMDHVFGELNRTSSAIGSQYLYHQLHQYETAEDKLQTKFKQYQKLQKNINLRKTIQRTLINLRHTSAYKTVRVIYEKPPVKPRFSFLFPILSALLPLALIVGIKFNAFFLVALGIAIINALIHQHFTPRIAGFSPDMTSFCTLMRAAESIGKLEPVDSIPEIKTLKRHEKIAKRMRSKIGWLSIDTSQLDDNNALMVEYFNFFLLRNLISYIHYIDEMKDHQNTLIQIYEAVGSLDAAIAVAGYLESGKHYCMASIDNKHTIDFFDVYHPLLDEPVANSFASLDKSCLITGSNMSGKTTFIKTIGVNIILARALGFCLATSAKLPCSMVKTSITRQDSLEQGKSYYFMEIEEIATFLGLATGSDKSFVFLIDEIFRGTNTIERLASATAVLDSLCNDNICFVTTHDIELQELLGDRFAMYHFQEQVEGGRYFFDYNIKHGPCLAGNAINLLELKGYPAGVVERARTLAKHLAV